VTPQLSNEEELVDMVTGILQNDPRGFTDVSALGTQLQKVSGHTWNAKFKPRYGALSEFVESRKEYHLDGNHVYLKKKWDEVKAEREEKQAKKQAKKARREERSNPQPESVNDQKKHTDKHTGSNVQSQTNHGYQQHHDVDHGGQGGHGFCYKFCIFLVLLWVLLAVLLFLYQQGVFKSYLNPQQTALIDRNYKKFSKHLYKTSQWLVKETNVYSKLLVDKVSHLPGWILSQLRALKLIK